MKRMLACLLALLLALPALGTALAEEEQDGAIVCRIENGSYVIRIPVAEGDENWYVDEFTNASGVVRAAKAQFGDHAFTVQIDPVSDGDATVVVCHRDTPFTCDQVHTWDVRVRDGAVVESVGGSFTASPDEMEMEPFFSGEWLEKDTQFTCMTVKKNPEKGWDVEITSPMTHGAFVFRAAVCYDCYFNALLYRDGRLFDLPADGGAPGDPAQTGLSGGFVIEEMSDQIALRWTGPEAPSDGVEGEGIVFVRPETFEGPAAE